MNERQILNSLRAIVVNAKTAGAVFPKPIRDGYDQLQRLMEQADKPVPQASIAECVLDALVAGRDPVDDDAVRRAVVARVVSEVLQPNGPMHRAVALRAQEFLAEHSRAILASFDKPFTAAAATIAESVDKLGRVDLSDPAAVLARGGDAARLWGAIQDGEKVIKIVRGLPSLLAEADPAFRQSPAFRLLLIADPDPARALDENLASQQLPAWEIARRDIPLSLASTPEEFRDRIAAVQAEAARRDAAQEDTYRRRMAGSFT